MPLSYRDMTVADVPAIFEVRLSTIENAVTLEELERDYGVTADSLAAAMQSSVRGWLCEDPLAEIASRVVGFAMGDRASGEVLVVAVRPGYERRGIGVSLLSRVQSWLFAEGFEEIWLLSNPDPSVRAHGFYRRLGWRTSGQRKGDDEILSLRRPEVTP